MLDDASAQDLGDHFEFTIGQGRRMEGEGPDNGLRFPVTADWPAGYSSKSALM
jgi:hypothetical protein